MYGQLIAKFDFPIFKTDAALKVEKDSITKHFQPYYNINQTVEQKKIEQFKQAYRWYTRLVKRLYRCDCPPATRNL